MATILDDWERAAAGDAFGEGLGMAMRIVAEAGRLLGAPGLIPIRSAHIDGALYHGDSGTLFAEVLVAKGATVSVRSTLNVGALDLTGGCAVRLDKGSRDMARRQMQAYRSLGCEATWTCAPYQAGHRPEPGTDVAWGESNAVAFCNSVLGARTNRYGDLLDIACAIAGRAPDCGLHRAENRKARIVLDVSRLPEAMRRSPAFWPVLGSFFGRAVGETVGAIAGIASMPHEDDLKAFGAAAASTGAVGLYHVVGWTPEAPDITTACGGLQPAMIEVTPDMLLEARRQLSTTRPGGRIDAVAVGSPHLSCQELQALEAAISGRRLAVPLYACTGRHALEAFDRDGRRATLEKLGLRVVTDTCIVVTPIMEEIAGGVLMTNSGKFAQYAPGNTGYGVVFGSLSECVESAVSGSARLSGTW